MKNFIIAACAMSIGVMASQAQNFDNSVISTAMGPFGDGTGQVATFGQVFTAPNSVLDDWTIYLDDGPQNFEFFLMAWNGSEATGPVLYQSSIQTMNAPVPPYITPFTVHPDTTITIGGSYVMFINASGLNVGTNASVVQYGNATSPLGGSFVFLRNGDNFSEVTTTPWLADDGTDAAYIADFSTAPEPTTLALAAFGGLSLALLRLRKEAK